MNNNQQIPGNNNPPGTNNIPNTNINNQNTTANPNQAPVQNTVNPNVRRRLDEQLAPPVRNNTSQITQADLVTTPTKMPDVISRTIFSSYTVKNLGTEDFNINSKELITLNEERCSLVLFYVENEESKQLATIWAIAAQQTAGPLFCAVNMLNEHKVAEAFTKLKSANAHPLHPYGLRGYPFIIVYRSGWPIAFYNGSRSVNAIIDYALTLACNIDYSEPISLSAGMQAEYQAEMSAYDIYSNNQALKGNQIRKTSIEYQDKGIRGFNPNLNIALNGSKEKIDESKERNKQTLEEIAENQEENNPVVRPT